jgi:hypothetical protein
MWAEICEVVNKNFIRQEAILAVSNVSSTVSQMVLHRTLGFHKVEVKIRGLQAYSMTNYLSCFCCYLRHYCSPVYMYKDFIVDSAKVFLTVKGICGQINSKSTFVGVD